MEVKLFEVRDRMTCIAAIAIKPGLAHGIDPSSHRGTVLRFLLGKAGWNADHNSNAVLFGQLEGDELKADVYAWPENPRTMRLAHRWVQWHWRDLASGDVIDVRAIEGEEEKPARSDAFYAPGGE